MKIISNAVDVTIYTLGEKYRLTNYNGRIVFLSLPFAVALAKVILLCRDFGDSFNQI